MSMAAAAAVGAAFWAVSQANAPESFGNVAQLTRTRTDLPEVVAKPTPAPVLIAPRIINNAPPQVIAAKYVKPAPPAPLKRRSPKPQAAAEPAPLPGEASFQKTIAAMQQTLGAGDSVNLSPKLRAVYERNVALLDQAIRASQKTARRNPQDADAAEFLYSSYRSKVDLLSAIANQTRPLIAER